MGLFDGLIDTILAIPETLDGFFDDVSNPDLDNEQATDVIGDSIADVSPSDEIGAALVDIVEEFVLSEIEDAGTIDPADAERLADATEGAAINVLGGLAITSSAIEAAGLGQLDSQTEFLTQALAGLGVDDVTGLELDARMSEGLMPALKAEVNAEHRSKFVDLQDAVEYALRNKQDDDLYLRPANAPQKVVDALEAEDPETPNNLIEQWGIRDDQLDVLEEVGINDMEFEELIETPAQLGLIVPDDVLEAELDRSGYAEETKEFLSQVNDRIPQTATAYQELLETEELIRELDALSKSGVLSPDEAVDVVPDDVPIDEDALRRRYQIIRDIPAGVPSASDFEGAFASGYLSLDELRDRLDQTDYPTDQYEAVLKKQVLDELDGDLQQAVGLGLLSEAVYSDLAEFAGLDDATVDLLLQGQGFSDIVPRRLQEQTAPADRSVGTIVGIGESRARALDAIGIETVADLADANAGDVRQAAQVSPETAEEFIQAARQRV